MSDSSYQVFLVRPKSFKREGESPRDSHVAIVRSKQSDAWYSRAEPRKPALFSRLSQKLMNFIVRLACLYRIVPLKLVQVGYQNSHLTQTESSGRLACKLMTLQVVVLATLSVLGFRIRWMTKYKKNLMFMGFHSVKIMQFASASAVMSMPLLYPREVSQVYNSAPALHQQLLSIGLSCPQWFEDPIVTLPIMSIHASTWFVPFVVGAAGFLNPSDPFTPSGLLQLVTELPRWLQPPLTTYEVIMMHMAASSYCFILVLYWTYYVNLLKWLGALKKPNYKSLEQELFALERSHTFFHSMYLFSTIFNIASVNLLSSMTCGIVAMTTVTLFALLTQHSRLPLLVYSIFGFAAACLLFVIVVVMSQLGQIQKKSRDMIQVWSHRVTYLRARLASRKDIRHDLVGRVDRLSRMNRSLRFFGIRFANIYFSVKSSPKIVEAMLTFLIIALSMRQELR